ncbi:MAG TPA: hypothetical protein VFW29_10195 [Solirubrobacteraceae bacterium]|nr:hypothetical protein [Solirubrobacteraceae bacterium]
MRSDPRDPGKPSDQLPEEAPPEQVPDDAPRADAGAARESARRHAVSVSRAAREREHAWERSREHGARTPGKT